MWSRGKYTHGNMRKRTWHRFLHDRKDAGNVFLVFLKWVIAVFRMLKIARVLFFPKHTYVVARKIHTRKHANADYSHAKKGPGIDFQMQGKCPLFFCCQQKWRLLFFRMLNNSRVLFLVQAHVENMRMLIIAMQQRTWLFLHEQNVLLFFCCQQNLWLLFFAC